MAMRLIRSLHYKRVPSYDGYWAQILNRALESEKKSIVAVPARTPLAIPFEPVEEPPLQVTPVNKLKKTVYLNGTHIILPDKPDPPENCCMSGCAHCVWDMYAEDMEDYAMEKSAIRNKFKAQGVPLPKELEVDNKNNELAEMDPSMKAYLDMEKKLKNL